MNNDYKFSLKDKFIESILHDFLEFCYENAEVDLYPDYFYGNESKIIRDFLEDRQKKYEE